MKQIFILFLLWFGLSLSAQDQISLLFVGDLMQHQAQIDAARQGDGYNYNDCFRDRKSTRLNSSHIEESRMPSSA